MPPAKKRAKKSAARPTTTSGRLTRIEGYLASLYGFMRKYSWGATVKRKPKAAKKKGKGNGGEHTGSNPPKWPP